MKKFIACLLIAMAVTVGQLSAFAIDEDKIITDVSVYTGTLYLSDWEDGGVVLQNVKPVNITEDTNAIASRLEYTEVSAFDGNIRSGSSGAWLDLDSLAWFLDMDVKVVVARLAGGELRIVSIVTQ